MSAVDEPTEEEILRNTIWLYEDTLAAETARQHLAPGLVQIAEVSAYAEKVKAQKIEEWERLTGETWPPRDFSDPTDFPDSPSLIDLTYVLSTSFHDDNYYDLDTWRVSADIDSSYSDGRDHHVGEIELISIDLDLTPKPFAALDALDQCLSNLGGTILNLGGRGLKPSLQEQLDETFESRILILNKVSLGDRWRGSGWLGALLAGEAINRLSSGVGLVFTYPYPLEGRDASKQDVRKLQAVWRKLGFTHYRGGFYVLDLSSTALTTALVTLRKNLNL